MQVCAGCGSELVQPAAWEQRGPDWSVELRCPECALVRTGTFAQEEVDEFDDALDQGTHELERELAARTRENMGEYAARFTAALHADAILPMDF
jgi:hypothetical protein